MDNSCKSYGNKANNTVRLECGNSTNSLKKKIAAVFLLIIMTFQLAACSLQMTCKVDGCDETDIYEDGYCKYHYYKRAGENLLKDIFN